MTVLVTIFFEKPIQLPFPQESPLIWHLSLSRNWEVGFSLLTFTRLSAQKKFIGLTVCWPLPHSFTWAVLYWINIEEEWEIIIFKTTHIIVTHKYTQPIEFIHSDYPILQKICLICKLEVTFIWSSFADDHFNCISAWGWNALLSFAIVFILWYEVQLLMAVKSDESILFPCAFY
jgi:hypothetical protein